MHITKKAPYIKHMVMVAYLQSSIVIIVNTDKMKVIVLLLVAVALFSTGAESQRSQYYDPDPDQDSEGDFADEVPIAPFLRDFLKPFPLLLPPPRPPPNPEFDNLYVRKLFDFQEKIILFIFVLN